MSADASAEGTRNIPLSLDELRAVTTFAVACAEPVLELFESAYPEDRRPREAIDAARAFAAGGARGKRLRDTAWAALKAAGVAGSTAAGDAARAAMAAAGAAYLHPLADADQVKHILGSAAHAARAAELAANGDRSVGAARLAAVQVHASTIVVEVLRRYPPAPAGGGRLGELVRELDTALRG